MKTKTLNTRNTTKKVIKKVTPTTNEILKVVKEKRIKTNFHVSLLNVNKLDKQENFSLSGALNRFKKQIPNDENYKGIDTNVIENALKFENILKYVNQKCIEKQRFTVYSVGLAFNKYLKVTL